MKAIPTPMTREHPNRKDAQQVEVLSGMGATDSHIAHHLKMSVEEMLVHYSTSIERGKEEANLQVAKAFHDLAISGEHPMATVAWMKMRAGWSDATAAEADTSLDEEETQVARDKLLTLLNRGK